MEEEEGEGKMGGRGQMMIDVELEILWRIIENQLDEWCMWLMILVNATVC